MLYAWFPDYQIISICQSSSFYGAQFVHSHSQFFARSLSLSLSHSVEGISLLVLWRSHLHTEHEDHSSVKHQSCSRHWTGVPLNIITYYSYINVGFQQHPLHTSCALPYAHTTAEPRVWSKTPARKSIHCTRVCRTHEVLFNIFNIKANNFTTIQQWNLHNFNVIFFPQEENCIKDKHI